MSRSRWGSFGKWFAVMAVLVAMAAPSVAADGPARSQTRTPEVEPVQVALSAAHSTVSWDERDQETRPFEMPLLYLHHQRAAASLQERTLSIAISGPVSGHSIQLGLTSLHTNVLTGHPHRLQRSFQLPNRPCSAARPCTLEWTLEPDATYSDFYSLRVQDATGNLLWQNPQADRPDLVALDTWDVVADEYTVRIYHATLFPFARGPNDLDHRLSPNAVTGFVEDVFASLVAETWQTQFHKWGFGPVHPDWDPDRTVEIIVTDPPFALMGGTGTYTTFAYQDGTVYPERRLWWHATNAAFQAYDTLEHGYRVLFAHEFFHMVQWNVILSAGCSTSQWLNVFIEAQGKTAPSVQYPELEMRREHIVQASSEYGQAAKQYLASRLETSYEILESEAVHKYDGALYWRFLYEQSGDMRVWRTALEEMACHYSPDIVGGLPTVMDAALERAGGPFASFEESLVGFAQANYALRLEHGRCKAGGWTECQGRYYDPDSIYAEPALAAELRYEGGEMMSEGSIPASYGTDLIELYLDPSLKGQRLTVTLEGAGARLSVQVWKVNGNEADRDAARLGAKLGEVGGRPRALTAHPMSVQEGKDGAHRLTIPHVDPARCDRLALIVTRVDADEHLDPVGAYRIHVESTAAW